MPMLIEIPEPLASQVTATAKSRGASPADVVVGIVRDRMDAVAQLRKVYAEVAEQLPDLGESEEEMADYLEEVKDEMRSARRAAGPSQPPLAGA